MKYAIRYAACALSLLLGCTFTPNRPDAFAQQQNTSATSSSSARPAPTPTPSTSSDSDSNNSASTQRLAPLDINARATERAIDASIPDDPAVESALAPYTAKVRALNVPIGKLAGNLKKSGIGGGSLGNFVSDAIRERASAKLGKPVLLAVINSGGLRKNDIAAGDLTASDIYQLLPFENALVTLDLTGEQLRKFLDVIVAQRDAQSGARIVYRTNAEKKNEIVSVTLNDAGKEIDPTATYTIVTIDYLVKRGGDYSILQQAKNIRPLNITMRDAVLDYVRAETTAGHTIKATLDGRFKLDRGKSATATTEGDQP